MRGDGFSGFVSGGVLSAQQFQWPSPYERRHHQRCVAEAGVFIAPEYYWRAPGSSRRSEHFGITTEITEGTE
jgi:hypothetical protein